MPVFAASVLRPLTEWAASSSASVVRMPTDLSLEAQKADMPSISEIGYVMVLDIKRCLRQGASGELAKSRGPRDDLAHLIRTDFVAAEPEKFTGDILNLGDAETEAHQPGSDRHDAAAHQSRETATLVRGRDRGFRARNRVDQRLNFVRRTLAAQKTEHNAHGFFSDSTIDAGF